MNNIKLFYFLILFLVNILSVTYSKRKPLNNIQLDPSNLSSFIGEQFTAKRKSKLNNKIHIVTITTNDNISNYNFAINTVQCYARQYNYNYKLLSANNENKYTKNCRQSDFMYQRHCILANYMVSNSNTSDIILFLDADMAVINPNQLLEDYIQKGNEEIIFYERMYNHEIMAGSYFIKNNAYGLKFLKNWINYDSQKPKSFDGSDNASLHNVLIDMFITNNVTKEYENCKKIWKNSKRFNDIRIYVACLRVILNSNSEKIIDSKNLNSWDNENYSYDKGRIKVIKKLGRRKWARDIWLDYSNWSPQDFFLHDIKIRNLDTSNFRSWNSPWKNMNFDLKKCDTEKYYENWTYNPGLLKKRKYMKSQLRDYVFRVDNKFLEDVKEGKKLIMQYKKVN
uniref:Nucleotid_trans domain-containing protein n=1 Tax=Parastrongyloides trichosuri TaxID=131310 RepID=A0A0N4ZHJ2_PARTI